ncbi:MAG: hypothetical protein GF308_16430 [Candidatus Heimdallarchaeota archaeon]|nr:hypothetical protein [Candidatus Heimdallarchaeota archaeon]
MNVQPGCPECEKSMNFVVAKLTDEENPQPEDVKSGWYCTDCGIFRPSEMVAEINVETLDLDLEEAIRVTSSAAIFIPDEWVLEDKTDEVLETLKNVKPDD